VKNIKMPNLYIIAGCNGAGKTTASYTLLPDMLNCKDMNNEKIKELREKILQGIELAYKKLILTKSKNDEKLVYSEDGKIVFINAADLTK
jgi:predicted ABC-type ATPase